MRTFAVLAWLLIGCHSLRQDAETAYNRHDYAKAAELFDQLVAANPNDVQLRHRRTDARQRVLRDMLGRVRGAREIGKPMLAVSRLGELLDRRDDWRRDDGELAVHPTDAQTLAIEVAAAANDVDVEIADVTSKAGPLAAEAALGVRSRLLAHAELADRGRVLHDRVEMVGRDRCKALAAETHPDQPHWSWLVARYCGHFHADVALDRGRFDDLRQALTLDGEIAGLSAAEVDAFRAEVAAAFTRSAWYAPNGTGMLHGTIAGSIDVSFSSQPRSLSASWVEQVPYTDYVTESESYQEPYDDTESYTEEVPYTEIEWKTVPCGDSTCTTSETVTKYRTEWKTRTVTKYRTAWRDVQKAVTRYRDVPHVFDYQAIQRDGHYVSKLALQLDRSHPNLVDAAAAVDRDEHQTGIDHDVTFAEANVYPSRANLMTRAQLISAERERLQQRLLAVLDARYTAKFCTLQVYSRDAAAACAYLDLKTAPAAVHATLRGTFGGDEPLLAPVLAR